MRSLRIAGRHHSGFLLLEVLVGIVILGLFISSLILTLLYGQEGSILGGDRTRAAAFTERSIEAIRAMRDGNFASVTAGTHGIWIDRTTQLWAFSGAKVTLTGSYVSKVAVSLLTPDWLSLTGSTVWKHGYNHSGSVLIMTELTNWQTTTTVGNWGNPSAEGTYVDASVPLFNSIAVAGTTAYVATNATAGMQMLDITNTASPSRVNAGFSIGYGATDLAIRGKRLYVLTADPSAELKVYSIVSPADPVLVLTYDLPGAALGRKLSFGRYSLAVTASYTGNAGEHQLYLFDVRSSDSVVLRQTIDDTDTMNQVAIGGTGTFIASGNDASELRFIQIQQSGSFVGPFDGINLTDRIVDGQSIAVAGTSAILGTQKDPSTQEMVLFDTSQGVSASTPAYYHEGSGTIMGVAMDANRCYAFLGDSSGRKAFQVVNMRDKTTLPELFSYNSATGLARGIAYDLVRDRVYLLTDSAVIIFKPAAAGATCP